VGLNGFDKLLHIAALCNNATLNGNGLFHGDPTEGALLLFTNKYMDVKQNILKCKRVHESPFDSKTKRMITVNETDGEKTAYLKGAPEVVLQKCNRILLDNKVVPLTKAYKNTIEKHYNKIATHGERVLGLAFKKTHTVKTSETEFIFVALLGMADPVRKEVHGAIGKCKTAGIKVIMVTGDYSVTAVAVAIKCKMIAGHANVITGVELDKINDAQLQKFLQKDNIILARISPPHKLRVVKVLQKMGEVVTVTGDGVNDAPALKDADMGVAMGVIGTEVAKEASDMVLLNDNFATIVSAIEEGRTVYSNIRRFIAYILTSNIPQIVPFIAFVLLGLPLPLTVVLILSIDLGTDLLPALGLGTEKPEVDIMKIPPRSTKEHLLDWLLLFRSYGVIGPLEAAAGFFSYFIVLYSGGWHWGQSLAMHNPLYLKAISAFFASIVLCQISNVLICRTNKQSVLQKGLFTNKLIIFGIVTEFILLLIIIYNPLTQPFFGTNYLTIKQLLLSLPFVIFIFMADEFRKWFLRRNNIFALKYLNW
jgi:sodium/potassium-transporting ATPase subunit alpha